MIHKTIIINIETFKKNEMIDITDRLQKVVRDRHVLNGQVTLFVPHTTCGITINENADPNVKTDMLVGLKRSFPDYGDYQHFEGNSVAHIKASVFGFNETIIVDNGKLLLGVWQGVYLCEFDGPRVRKLYIQIID